MAIIQELAGAFAFDNNITGFNGFLSHSNTADRIYTFPDTTGNVLLSTNVLGYTLPALSAGYLQWTGSAWAFGAGGTGLTNPMTTLGDIIYENVTPAPTRLAGWTNASTAVLTQTGTGTISAVPVWTNTPSFSALTLTSSAALILQYAGRIDQKFYDSAAATDSKWWEWSLDGAGGANTFNLGIRNDAGTYGGAFLQATRTANALTQLTLAATTLNLNGALTNFALNNAHVVVGTATSAESSYFYLSGWNATTAYPSFNINNYGNVIGIGADDTTTQSLRIGNASSTGVWGSASTTMKVHLNSTTASTTSSTGALVVDGGVGIGGALNITGSVNLSGGLISAPTRISPYFIEKTLKIAFSSVANQAFDIVLGNLTYDSIIEVELCADYGSADLTGKIKQQYVLGCNVGNSFFDNTSSTMELVGTTANYLSLSTTVLWDATNTRYRIPVYAIQTTNANVTVRIKVFLADSTDYSATNAAAIVLSSIYVTAPGPALTTINNFKVPVALSSTFANPSATFYGVNSSTTLTATSANTQSGAALYSYLGYSGAYNAGFLMGLQGTIYSGASAGTINGMAGIYGVAQNNGAVGTLVSSLSGVSGNINQSGAGTAANAYLLTGTVTKTAGVITNLYGLYIPTINQGGTLNYAIYTNAGIVDLNDTNDIGLGNYSTGALQVAGGMSISKQLQVGAATTSLGINTAYGFNINQVPNPSTGSLALILAAGNLGIGIYWYTITFYTASGETNCYVLGPITTDGTHKQITVTIPISPDLRVIGRKIYRTLVGGDYWNTYALATVANNTATTFTDNVADSSLTVLGGYWQINSTTNYISVNGTRSLVVDGWMTALGQYAGSSVTTGGLNTFIGQGAGKYTTSGHNLTFVGNEAGLSNTSGTDNTYVGLSCGDSITTGSGNTGMGRNTLGGISGDAWYNTLIGYEVFGNGAGAAVQYNTALGHLCGYNAQGNYNLYLGAYAGYYETTNNNVVIIDTLDRTTQPLQASNALFYGTTNITASSQTLQLGGGGSTTINGLLTLTASKGMVIPSGIPGTLTNTLYQYSSIPYFNGNRIPLNIVGTVATPTYRNSYASSTASVASVAVTAGDLIVISFSDNLNTDTTVTCADTNSNVYTQVGGIYNQTNGTIFNSVCFWAIAKSTTTLTITATPNLSLSPGVRAIIFYNINQANPFQQIVNNKDGSAATSHSSGTVTTANTNDLAVCIWENYTISSALTDTAGFTNVSVNGSGYTYKVITSPTSVTDTATSASTIYTSQLMIFNASTAASGATVSGITLDSAMMGIVIPSGTPATTTNALYNNGGALYWNGSAVGGGGGSLPSTQIGFGNGSSIIGSANLSYTVGTTSTGYVTISNTTPSTTTTTGALVVSGGVGVLGQVTSGFVVAGNVDPINTTSTLQNSCSITDPSAAYYGAYFKTSLITTATNTQIVYGLLSVSAYTGANNIGTLVGMYAVGQNQATAGTCSQLTGLYVVASQKTAGATTTNSISLQIANTKSAGTVVNGYGLVISDIATGSTSNYAIQTGLGIVNLGDTTASTTTTTGALVVSGGVGIAGSLYGVAANFSGLLTSTNGAVISGIYGTVSSLQITGTTTNPTVGFYGIYSAPTLALTSASSGFQFSGINATQFYASAYNITNTLPGLVGGIFQYNMTGAATVSNAAGIYITGTVNNASSTISNHYGIYISNPYIAAGALGTNYGIYITALGSTGGTNFAFYSAGQGKVYIGDTSSAALQVQGSAIFSTRAYAATMGALSGTSVTLDAAASNNFTISPTAGTTVTFNNPINPILGQIINIILVNPSGTAPGLAFGAAWQFPSSINVVMSGVTGQRDIISAVYDGTLWIANISSGTTTGASYAVYNQTMYIGTTAVTINRTSGALTLAGIAISGSSTQICGITLGTSSGTANMSLANLSSINTSGATNVTFAGGGTTTVTLPTISGTMVYYTSAPAAQYNLSYAGGTSGLVTYLGNTAYGTLVAASTGAPQWTTPTAGVLYQATTTTVPVFSPTPTMTLPVFSTGATFTASAGGTTAGEFWYDSTQLCHTSYVDGVKQFQHTVTWVQTADGVTSGTSAITMLGTGIGTLVFPANFFVSGKTAEVKLKGLCTTAASPGTEVITVIFNAGTPVTVGTTTSATPTGSLTAIPFELELLITARSTTSVMVSGNCILHTGTTVYSFPITSSAAVTIVAATSYTLDVRSTNGTSSGCVFTSKTGTVKILA